LRRFFTKKTSARGGGARVISRLGLIVGLDVEFDVAGVDTGARHVDAVGLTSIRQFALNRCSLGAVEVIRASHLIAFAAYLPAEWITTWTIPKASKI
jgi:hypothetical protein